MICLFSTKQHSILNLITNNVALEVIKVNMTPPDKAVINEPNLSVFINQVFNVPTLRVHRLRAGTSLLSDNLKYEQT